MTDFENAMKKVADVLHAAAKKSGEIFENTKISYNISAEKDKIAKLQEKIGAKFCKIYKEGGDVPEFILAELREIATVEETISALEKTIADSRPYKYCPECGAKLELSDVYCAKCGAKQRPTERCAREGGESCGCDGDCVTSDGGDADCGCGEQSCDCGCDGETKTGDGEKQ